jgi:SAM-dependent methyltransferase
VSPQVSIYDEVAFPSYPYPVSHPARLATMARLCGLQSAPIENCRVLELGCGAGGNLLPMADGLPGSQFVGVDLSEQQIGLAQQWIAPAELQNVRFLVSDLLDLDASLGKFDYLIVHGVYSWTTDAVRDKILQLCRELLAANGVAYINYNTYPGWHLQRILRDMLQLHTRSISEPAERIREARRLIEFLDQTWPAPGTPLGDLLRSELAALRRHTDPFLFHAYVNVINHPVHWNDFRQQVTAQGLRYVTDAEPGNAWPERASGGLLAALNQLSVDESQWPQYADFARFTTSRRSLLCHQMVAAEHGPRRNVLRDLHASAALHRGPAKPPATGVAFTSPTGRSVTTNDPQLIDTFQSLADQWPASISIKELELQLGRDPLPESWLDNLLQCFCTQLIDLSIRPSDCARSVPRNPRASALARAQASQLDFVVNRRHETVRVSELDRRCLKLLDGARTVEQLAHEVGAAAPEILVRLATNSLLEKD